MNVGLNAMNTVSQTNNTMRSVSAITTENMSDKHGRDIGMPYHTIVIDTLRSQHKELGHKRGLREVYDVSTVCMYCDSVHYYRLLVLVIGEFFDPSKFVGSVIFTFKINPLNLQMFL